MKTMPEKAIDVNLVDFYCMKLRKLIRTSFSLESMNTCQLSDLFSDTKNSIDQFNRL